MRIATWYCQGGFDRKIGRALSLSGVVPVHPQAERFGWPSDGIAVEERADPRDDRGCGGENCVAN